MKLLVLFSFFCTQVYASSMLGLKVGSTVPEVRLKLLSGKVLNTASPSKKTILVFYRGSWCPYCVKQLKDLEANLVPKLKNSQLVAISVDRPATAKIMQSTKKFSFGIASDSKALSLKAFNIVNKVSEELVKKYKNSYQIDIEGDSGETHHMIAHPAVFVLSKDGKVLLSDVHEDYKQRTDIKLILKNL